MITHESRQDVAVRVAGLLLFVVAVAIFAASVLRAPLAEGVRLDLHPWPDGQEYLAAAVSLYRDHAYVVELAGQQLPPRYPFGFSALMVPLLAGGLAPISVPFVANAAIGLALIVGVFAALWRRHPLAAGIGAALLASWPAFVIVCRSPLSDVSAGAVVLLGFWGLVAFAGGGSAASGVAGALLLGVSIWFRIANFCLAPMVLIASLALRASWRRRTRAALLLGTAFAIGLAPLLWYNLQHFGSPLETGYSVWVPRLAPPLNAFKLRYIWRHLLGLYMDASGGPRPLTTAFLYGPGTYQSPALVGLMGVAVLAGLRSRADVAAAASVAIGGAGLLAYVADDARLLFPALIVTIPFVARESAALIERSVDEPRLRSGVAAAVVAFLIAAAIVQFPQRSGWIGLPRLLDVERFRRVPSVPYTLVQRLEAMSGGQPALVLTDLNPIYVSALTPVKHVILPLRRMFQPYREQLIVNDDDRERLVREGIATNQTVFLLVADSNTTQGRILSARPPPGYTWVDRYASGSAYLSSLVRKPGGI